MAVVWGTVKDHHGFIDIESTEGKGTTLKLYFPVTRDEVEREGPWWDGLDTYRRVLEVRPDQKAVITSGFSETRRVRKAQKLGANPYVKKPYTLERIGTAVKSALQK